MATEEEKQADSGEGEGGGQASRARNRTVMLTPEITGEVRARLAQDMAAGAPADSPAPIEEPTFGGGASEPQPSAPAPAAAPAQMGGAPAEQAPVTPSAPAAPAPQSVRQGVIWTKTSPITGFLVSYDEDENGEVFELRMGRLIVTSEPPGTGNFLVLDHDTVSSMHAIIRMAGFGEVQILDQLSEYGTRIVRSGSGKEEDLSGDKSVLHHGDAVMFGERKFTVCLVNNEED